MIWILILNHLYLGDLILILKSSTYDDFAHLWMSLYTVWLRVRNKFDLRLFDKLNYFSKHTFMLLYINYPVRIQKKTILNLISLASVSQDNFIPLSASEIQTYKLFK